MLGFLPAKVANEIVQVREQGLKRIDLSDSGLRYIPNELFEMPQLEEIDLNKNHIKYISPKIKSLINLQVFDLNQNEIEKIPKEIRYLKNLKQLGLSFNALKELPIELFDLSNLEVLGLMSNNIEWLPVEISNLEKLMILGLSNNKIKAIPSSFVKLINLKSLYLKGNPIINPPPEIALSKSNTTAIVNYFLQIEEEKNFDFLYEIKLLLVGNGGVGKTTLSKRLINNENFNYKDIESTEGINIDNWVIEKEEFNKISIEKDTHRIKDSYSVNLWDFGGQEIYHSTHQFFLTKRSLYLLVTESRKEDSHNDFYYWLNVIKVLGDNSPIILILNKCDQPTKSLPIKEYQEKFNNIIEFYKVSCLGAYHKKIEVLKDEIKRLIINKAIFSHIGTRLPKAWVVVRKELEKLKKQGKNYISITRYTQICKKNSIDTKKARWLLDFYHDLGIVLYFHNIELDDLVILNHEWVTKGVYNVLDNKGVIKSNGIFTDKELRKIWTGSKYRNKRKELLALMKKFELCFDLDEGKYLAPQMLHVDKVNFDLEGILNQKKIKKNLQLTFEFEYDFLPKGILPRLIIKQHKKIYENCYWRFGVILEFENSLAIIHERFLSKKIEIKIFGENRRSFLVVIRETIKEINSSFNNLKIDELLPCICTECNKNDKKYHFKLDSLRRRVKLNRKTIECDVSLQSLLIEDILNGIFTSDFKKEIKDLLAKDKISNAFEKLDMKLIQINDYDIQNELILLKNRYQRNETEKYRNTISNDAYSRNKSVLIRDILTILNIFP